MSKLEVIKYKQLIKKLLQEDLKQDINVSDIEVFELQQFKNNYNFKYKDSKFLIKDKLFDNIVNNNQNHIIKYHKELEIDLDHYIKYNFECAKQLMNIFENKDYFNLNFKNFPKIKNVYNNLIEVEYYDDLKFMSTQIFFNCYNKLMDLYNIENQIIPLEISKTNVGFLNGDIIFFDFDALTTNKFHIQNYIYSYEDDTYWVKGNIRNAELYSDSNNIKQFNT